MIHNLPASQWVKSSYSGNSQSDCVEHQVLADGLVAVGDSKNRDQGAFAFSADAWGSFVTFASQFDV